MLGGHDVRWHNIGCGSNAGGGGGGEKRCGCSSLCAVLTLC